nr:MAG TPA: hypothetical protein [Caudoviricetes sp.]
MLTRPSIIENFLIVNRVIETFLILFLGGTL